MNDAQWARAIIYLIFTILVIVPWIKVDTSPR